MNKRILRLAVPSILANITVPLVGMVDLAIAGHLGDATLIGGIAIGSMLFDMLYWNFGFLRVGTSGFTAQSYGRRDFREAVKILIQSVSTAVASAALLLLIQFPFVFVAFKLIDCSSAVAEMAKIYFFIRIWAAPATLSLFVLKGWFIGMQNSISPMILDVLVNVCNFVFSLLFAVVFGMGVKGIALGTLVAQYIGLITGLVLLAVYYGKLRKYIRWKESLKLRGMKNFFSVNIDLFIRSICFLCVYVGLTTFSAKTGDVVLAVNTIMMKLMLLYSYFVDGFAYAGEALTGRYIGAKDPVSLRRTVYLLFVWSFCIGLISTLLYAIGGDALLRMMTSNEVVIEAAQPLLVWLLVMPCVSCIAFMWDGIYIGATASAALRNVMLLSVLGFFIAYYCSVGYVGIHAVWVAYITHIIVRSIGLTALAGKSIYRRT